MLMIEDITIKSEDNSVIEGLTYDIKRQSILLVRNGIEIKDFAKNLIGKKPILNGKIYVKKTFVESNKLQGYPFFFIPSNLVDYWSNFKLSEIASLVTKRSKEISKQLWSRHYFDELSKVERIKFFVEVGESIGRKIFIFENPVERLDYKEIEEFKQLVLTVLANKSYIIIDRKLNEVYEGLEIPVYYF